MFTSIFQLLSHVLGYVGYIKSNTFLQPLSKEEEKLCIKGLQEQNEDCRNKLIEHNLRLVAHIVKKYDIQKEQTEDLISVGTIGLIKGIDSFNPEKGHKLTTYVSRCIENEILMYLRSSKNYFKNVSLNEPIATDKDGGEITLIDTISAPEQMNIIDGMVTSDQIKKLLQFLNVLDKREYEIIVQRFGLFGVKEKTQREIAKELHISRSYVSRIEKRAFMKLYKEFQKDEKLKSKTDTLKINKEL